MRREEVGFGFSNQRTPRRRSIRVAQYRCLDTAGAKGLCTSLSSVNPGKQSLVFMRPMRPANRRRGERSWPSNPIRKAVPFPLIPVITGSFPPGYAIVVKQNGRWKTGARDSLLRHNGGFFTRIRQRRKGRRERERESRRFLLRCLSFTLRRTFRGTRPSPTHTRAKSSDTLLERARHMPAGDSAP